MDIKNYKNIKYIISLPNNFSLSKKYPLLVFLHGAGTRGDDINKLIHNPFFTNTGDNLSEFITVAPQCFADNWLAISEQLHEFIYYMTENQNVDKKRCYLMGASMGGYAVWQEAMSFPQLYAAIVPICGGGMYWNAAKLRDVKVRAFHGSDDQTVYPDESKKMVDAVNSSGGEALLTIFNGVKHNSWEKVYKDKSVFQWLLAQEKGSEATENRQLRNSEKFG